VADIALTSARSHRVCRVYVPASPQCQNQGLGATFYT
jgi:hypothetical protein